MREFDSELMTLLSCDATTGFLGSSKLVLQSWRRSTGWLQKRISDTVRSSRKRISSSDEVTVAGHRTHGVLGVVVQLVAQCERSQAGVVMIIATALQMAEIVLHIIAQSGNHPSKWRLLKLRLLHSRRSRS